MELDKSKEDIISEFGKRRTREYIITPPMIMAFICVVIARYRPEALFGISPDIVFMVGIPLFIFLMTFSWLNWRCPNCRKYFGRAVNPKFCSRCGAQLR